MLTWVQATGHIINLTSNKKIKENLLVLMTQEKKGNNDQSWKKTKVLQYKNPSCSQNLTL